MKNERQIRVAWTFDCAGPIFLAVVGAIMFALALTQPAWLDGRIGPGLFARWLSAAVVGMSFIWLATAVLQKRPRGDAKTEPVGWRALRHGVGLLAGVAFFALALPLTGLVAACALTALVVSWGAGDRGWQAYLISGLSGIGVALALGFTLLPPGTRLWPPGL